MTDPILRGGKRRPPGPPRLRGADAPLVEAEAVLAGQAPLPRDGDALVFENGPVAVAQPGATR